jgi:hypothetical protein
VPIVVTMHKFDGGEETIFEDSYFWGTQIEDEAMSTIFADDGGEANLTGHPANNYLEGLQRNGFTAHYLIEFGVLSRGLAGDVWEVADAGAFALGRWSEGEPEVWYDTSVHTDRLRAGATPSASAVTRAEHARHLPADWPRPTVVADSAALHRFLGGA